MPSTPPATSAPTARVAPTDPTPEPGTAPALARAEEAAAPSGIELGAETALAEAAVLADERV